MTADRELTALHYLQTLWPAGLPDGSFLTLWSKGLTVVQEARCEVAARAIANDTRDYLNCGVLSKLTCGRGSADDVTAIPSLWLDLDVAGGAHKTDKRLPTEAEALAILDELPLPPSLVIASGGGFYPHWVLREPWLFESPEERQRAASLCEGWQRYVIARLAEKGFACDFTGDLPRVLRAPGGINRKYDPPREVVLLRESERRYNPSDFDEYASFAASGGSPESQPAGAPSGRKPTTVDEYNRVGGWRAWHEVLGRHGAVRLGERRDGEKVWFEWRRPGKDEGSSATTGYCTSQNAELLKVFTSNWEPFEQGKSYSRFRAYVLLNCGGNHGAAMAELGLKAEAPGKSRVVTLSDVEPRERSGQEVWKRDQAARVRGRLLRTPLT